MLFRSQSPDIYFPPKLKARISIFLPSPKPRYQFSSQAQSLDIYFPPKPKAQISIFPPPQAQSPDIYFPPKPNPRLERLQAAALAVAPQAIIRPRLLPGLLRPGTPKLKLLILRILPNPGKHNHRSRHLIR